MLNIPKSQNLKPKPKTKMPKPSPPLLVPLAESLQWAAWLSISFLLLPLIAVGMLVLMRNRWLAVALRYCLSVAVLQREGGFDFRHVPVHWMAVLLQGVSIVLLGFVGLVVAVYLTVCYVVSGRGGGEEEGGERGEGARGRGGVSIGIVGFCGAGGGHLSDGLLLVSGRGGGGGV